MDFATLRERLGKAQGKQYWRCLEELAEGHDFRAMVQEQFPEQAEQWTNPVTRRRFLALLGASLGLAGLSGCTRPPAEKILPYVRQPEDLIPGKPLWFATAMTLDGLATGVLVESHEGRPTKIEGNPDHPASLGATDAFAQASILTLYDPDRSRSVTHRGRIRGWDDVVQELQKALTVQREKKGSGLRVLTESISSPTLAGQLRRLLEVYPAAKWHAYDPVGRENVREGTRLAFGENLGVHYNLSGADVILSLDADFLFCGPGHLARVLKFSDRRRVRGDRRKMNRLYAVESTPTLTGAAADHRLPVKAAEVQALAEAFAAGLGVPVVHAARLGPAHTVWTDAVISDLQAHRGSSAVIAGLGQPPVVHTLAHAMNQALGNVGKTVILTDPVETDPLNGLPFAAHATLADLAAAIEKGAVDLLLVLGSNPVFTAPADLHFAERMESVPLRIHVGLYEDETARRCHWHLPEAHYLEAWSDARAFDGTASIMQPLIAPLHEGRSLHEVLALMTDGTERPGYEIVRDYWRRYAERHVRGRDFDAFWRRSVHDGVIAGTQLRRRTDAKIGTEWIKALEKRPGTHELEIIFRPDPTLYDGRFANNAWLQELPKPLTKLTWDNAALLSPKTAQKLGIGTALGQSGGGFGRHGGEHGETLVEVVRLKYRGADVEAPAWVLPGHPDDSVTVHFGYGRTAAGKVGTATGFDAYKLRTSSAPWFDNGLQIEKTGKTYTLAGTQQHYLTENRHLVRSATLDEYRRNPQFASADSGAMLSRQSKTLSNSEDGLGRESMPHSRRRPLSLYPEHEYPRYKWGMAIDLTACTGCGACVVACQAENNIPVVGKSEVTRGHEMHWLRIDRYYEIDPHDVDRSLANPRTYFQPVPCMHCENAPCELVCPVEATVHSDDGLNDMVYNRCVGTRYCSNNCPYKVRRFNFLQYADYASESMKLLRNPNVTVRSRGVMEKCTYCVQRIRRGEIEAEKRGGQVRDGELQTACQQACPARAIVFGDINDPASEVKKWKDEPLDYGLLADLNTRPRTTYMAALRNPNPELG